MQLTCRIVLALALAAAVPGRAAAQAGPPMTVNYDNTLYCASMYEVFSYEAEDRGDETAKTARLASSDKAYGRAGMLGVQEGRTSDSIKADMTARVEKLLDNPPSLQLARVAVQRCDEGLGLKTP